jgi:hypothetical protein
MVSAPIDHWDLEIEVALRGRSSPARVHVGGGESAQAVSSGARSNATPMARTTARPGNIASATEKRRAGIPVRLLLQFSRLNSPTYPTQSVQYCTTALPQQPHCRQLSNASAWGVLETGGHWLLVATTRGYYARERRLGALPVKQGSHWGSASGVGIIGLGQCVQWHVFLRMCRHLNPT